MKLIKFTESTDPSTLTASARCGDCGEESTLEGIPQEKSARKEYATNATCPHCDGTAEPMVGDPGNHDIITDPVDQAPKDPNNIWGNESDLAPEETAGVDNNESTTVPTPEQTENK